MLVPDMLEGCLKGSVEEAELEGIVDMSETYEAKLSAKKREGVGRP